MQLLSYLYISIYLSYRCFFGLPVIPAMTDTYVITDSSGDLFGVFYLLYELLQLINSYLLLLHKC